MLAHLFRPGSALRRRAKEGLRELLDVQTGMRVVPNAYPRELAPRALGGGHRLQYGVVIVTWVVAVVADRDQAETWRVDVLQDVLEEGRQVRGQRGLPGFRHLAEVHGAHTLAAAIQDRDGRRRPLLPRLVAQRHIDAITTYRQDRLKPAWRHPGLVEPADHLSDLGRLAMGRHPRTQTAQELPQGGTRPVPPRGLRPHLQPLALRMLRSPA